MDRQLSKGDEIGVKCPVCQSEKLARVEDDLKTAKMLDHLSPTKEERCDGSGREVEI